ncbi:hypothetical protein AAY473_000331 [Plecturocebus cupreus]
MYGEKQGPMFHFIIKQNLHLKSHFWLSTVAHPCNPSTLGGQDEGHPHTFQTLEWKGDPSSFPKPRIPANWLQTRGGQHLLTWRKLTPTIQNHAGRQSKTPSQKKKEEEEEEEHITSTSSTPAIHSMGYPRLQYFHVALMPSLDLLDSHVNMAMAPMASDWAPSPLNRFQVISTFLTMKPQRQLFSSRSQTSLTCGVLSKAKARNMTIIQGQLWREERQEVEE